jgi:uroporphyrinogen-III decarboxylase
MTSSGKEIIEAVLARRTPPRIAYAPNYWQWFAHHRNHGTLPPELALCRSQLDLIRHLGLAVFSRNLYCDEQRGWWGGLAEPYLTNSCGRELPRASARNATERVPPNQTCPRLEGRAPSRPNTNLTTTSNVEATIREWHDDRDLVIEKTFHTRAGTLTERLRYVWAESTLVQEKYLVDDYDHQLDALTEFVRARRWQFLPERWAAWCGQVGADGCVVAGELHSPLKMLHVLLGAQNATYFLIDHPERAAELLALHEAAMLDLVAQLAAGGVRVLMCMDNLDAAFHPPHYIEKYSASFYEKAAQLCHAHGALLFIHACGRQRDNLKLIASLGVDGLEGVAFPPLGDVQLEEALQLAGEKFIVTGGISAKEFERLQTRAEIFAYVAELLARLRPYAHRFILSASCNTPYTAPWERIVHFRDAWLEFSAT